MFHGAEYGMSLLLLVRATFPQNDHSVGNNNSATLLICKSHTVQNGRVDAYCWGQCLVTTHKYNHFSSFSPFLSSLEMVCLFSHGIGEQLWAPSFVPKSTKNDQGVRDKTDLTKQADCHDIVHARRGGGFGRASLVFGIDIHRYLSSRWERCRLTPSLVMLQQSDVTYLPIIVSDKHFFRQNFC